jgi:ferrochelatase
MTMIIFCFLTRVPERHIRKTDITKSHCKIDGSCCNTPSPAHEFCYRHQCYETTKQVVKLLGPEGKYSQTFQSRLAETSGLHLHGCSSEQNAWKGIKKLAVVTPAFVSDCLETLEEIAMEANHEFKVHGGEDSLQFHV